MSMLFNDQILKLNQIDEKASIKINVKSGMIKLPFDDPAVTSSSMTSGVTTGSSIPPTVTVPARAANITTKISFFIFLPNFIK